MQFADYRSVIIEHARMPSENRRSHRRPSSWVEHHWFPTRHNPVPMRFLGRSHRAFLVMTAIAFGISLAPHAWGQAGKRQFEVASIRPNTSPPRPWGGLSPFVFSPEGRFSATNVTLRDLIASAYQTTRIQGAPDWMDSDRY